MTPDPQDDLAYIRQVMEQTHRLTLMSGNYLIAWGVLISLGLACSGTVALTGAHLPLSAIWIGLVASGWACSFWLGRREARYLPVAGYATRLISWLWIACGAAMTTAFLIGGWTGAVPDTASGGLSALFIGIAVFMTGMLSGMHWFRNLAVGWWAGAVAMFIWHGQASIWLCAGLFIALLVVPGAVLNIQAQALRKSVR